MSTAPRYTVENPPDPMTTLHEVEKHARQEAETFTALHVVKPNAVMMSMGIVNATVSAVARLTSLGRRHEADTVLVVDPRTKQQTIAGLPVMISNRHDFVITGVLVGDPEILINANG